MPRRAVSAPRVALSAASSSSSSGSGGSLPSLSCRPYEPGEPAGSWPETHGVTASRKVASAPTQASSAVAALPSSPPSAKAQLRTRIGNAMLAAAAAAPWPAGSVAGALQSSAATRACRAHSSASSRSRASSSLAQRSGSSPRRMVSGTGGDAAVAVLAVAAGPLLGLLSSRTPSGWPGSSARRRWTAESCELVRFVAASHSSSSSVAARARPKRRSTASCPRSADRRRALARWSRRLCSRWTCRAMALNASTSSERPDADLLPRAR
mmetsp:Transcript_51201/g.158802  ORF Transcript_51201/g.158802 Transcript_51201/m.158802 type:complete len:267 (-) Transcript_51201:67-867(-)